MPIRQSRHKFDELVQRDESEVRVAEAALLFAVDHCRGLKIAPWLNLLDELVRRVDAKQACTGTDQIDALRTVLVDEEHFVGNTASYYEYGKERKNGRKGRKSLFCFFPSFPFGMQKTKNRANWGHAQYADPAAPPEGSRAAEKPEWIPMLRDDQALAELRRLRIRAEEEGLKLYDYAIRATANTPGISSIILGVRRSEQLEQAICALN